LQPIVCDALNVAYWIGHPPDLRLPLALMAELLQRDRQVFLYFDASAPHKLTEVDRPVYTFLRAHRDVIEVPSGKPADRLMLKHARSIGAAVVSRDKFRDQRRRFRRLVDDPSRLLSGAVSGNVLHVPGLDVSAPLADSTEIAWQRVVAASAKIAPP